LRGFVPQHREKNHFRVLATLIASLGYATSGHEIKHAVGARTLGANLKAAIIQGLHLSDLSRRAGAGFLQSYS
jgi:hypothetical protein